MALQLRECDWREDANVPFLSPNHMRVLISIKIATLNPFIHSRKQWKSNSRHEWLSGDAAQATKKLLNTWSSGRVYMHAPRPHHPFCHLFQGHCPWTLKGKYNKESRKQLKNKSWFHVHGADPEHHPVLWDTSVPLVTWQKGSLCNKIAVHHHTSNEAMSHILPDTWPNSSTSDPLMNTPIFSEKYFLRLSHGAELFLIEYKSCCCRKCL